MEITVKQMMQIEENGHQMGFLRKFMKTRGKIG
jgi:NAD(P)H-hydrate epimerase